MDPLQQSQQMPVAPDMMNSGSQPTTPDLSQEQMKSNLQGLMSKIEGKYQDFNSNKFAAGNKVAAHKSSAMRQLFELFKSMGVDPSNPKALKQFLDQLKDSNPELYQQVEAALEAMLGDGPLNTATNAGTTATAIANDAPIDNMNIDPVNAAQTV